MLTGRRVRVTGGPWPERVGCEGNVMIPQPGEERIYPFHGKSKDEEVIRLDADPIGTRRRWTCVIGRGDIDLVDGGKG